MGYFVGVIGRALLLIGLGLAGITAVQAQDDGGTPLKVLIFERAPYYKSNGEGGYFGLVATPATLAFKKAGIPVQWVDMQPNGHMRAIEANREPMCALGWFKTTERDAFSRYSDIIYTDQPSSIMTRTDNVKVQSHKTARGLLSDKSLRVGVKLGYSHGPYLDGLIDQLDPPRATVSQDETGLARMLLGGRFDYMMVSEVEAVVLMEEFGAAGNDIVLLTMADIPPGNNRYLVCSKATDPKLIERFTAALGESP